MTLEEKCMIFLFFGIHMSYFKAEVLTVPDPCPEISPTTKVADMCRQNEAVEEEENGYDIFDSVALRIKTQEDNCNCLVTIDNQTERNVIYITKYNNLNSAAPLVSDCGLEIDMDYPNPENQIKPISCSKTTLPLSFSLVQNGVLTLTSKVTSGNFTSGYCLQIITARITFDNSTLRVKCAAQGVIYYSTDQQPTRNVSSGVSTTTITASTLQLDNTTAKDIDSNQQDSRTDKQIDPKENNSAIYIGLGSGLAGAILLIAVVVIIYCKRKSTKRLVKKTENESVTAQGRTEDSALDLHDNIPYITSEQSDGDYTSIAVENSGLVSKNDDKMQRPANTSTSETSSYNQSDSNQNSDNNVYAVVDKSKRNQHQNAFEIKD